MAIKASSRTWVRTRVFTVEVRHPKHCSPGSPKRKLVEIETPQKVAEEASQIMLILESKINLLKSELKLVYAYLELADLDDNWKSYRLYKQQKLEKTQALDRYEELKKKLISDPSSYRVVGSNLLPTPGKA